MADSNLFAGSCIGISKFTDSGYCQGVAHSHSFKFHLIVDECCRSRSVVNLVLGCNATDDNCFLANRESLLNAVLVVSFTLNSKCSRTNAHVVSTLRGIICSCNEHYFVEGNMHFRQYGLTRIELSRNVCDGCAFDALRCDGGFGCCLLTLFRQLIIGNACTTQCQRSDIDHLVDSRIGIGKGAFGSDAQHITLHDTAIDSAVIEESDRCCPVENLILGSDATDDNCLLIDGHRYGPYFRVEMIGIAYHLIINGVITSIHPLGNDRLKGRAVKTVNQGASDSITHTYQLLSRFCVDKRLSLRGCGNLRRSLGNAPCPVDGSLPCATSRNRYLIRVHISP